jgi:transcriptional regulator with XRE-family HTH domain
MSRASLASIETGRQNVLVHQLYTFAAALELAVSDFLPAPTKLISNYDLKKLPFPDGLNAQQKEQIARMLLNGTEAEGTNYRGDDYEHKEKARPKKAGSRAS